jgi:tetratricopeptide (TPR) repeat protein
MVKIALRSYFHEIEGLIDKGQIEEAEAHCRHILQSFPKLLAAYRLMGKALLEARQYSDAADIFQRVLSSTPDDFISQVGMSIIREDGGTLDAAIWHMERAFEVQPYNVAIQDELRRLYGRRDGVEPPKVRLTRGALARMYAKGNLYQQAIAELRAGLLEEATRVDLQVVLARMYFLSGQRIEAVDTCGALLKKLPFCLEANRILSIILPETGRKDDAQVYLQRVQELDPYMIHADPQAVTSEAVPENIIMIERLDYQKTDTSAGRSSQPSWAASLGVNLDEFSPKQEEAIPDWLASIQQKVAADAKKDETPIAEQTPTEELKTVSPFIFKDSSPEVLDHPTSQEEENIEPPTVIGQSTVAEQLDKTELTGEESPADEAELPTWLSDLESTTQPVESQPSDEFLPDWMKEAGWVTSSSEPEAEPVGDISDNLTPQSQSGDEIAKAELPDWLMAMAPEGALEKKVTSAEEKVPIGEEEEPVAIQVSAPLEENIPGVNLDNQDEALDWLEGLAAKQDATEAELISHPEERHEIQPIWIQEDMPGESKAEAPGQAEGETTPETALPQELTSTTPVVERPAAEAQAEARSEISETDLPDWLRDMSEKPVTARPLEEAAVYEKTGEPTDLPEWLLAIDFPSETGPQTVKAWEEQGAVEIPASATLEENVPSVNQDEQDAAMTWLEELAAKQGAEALIEQPAKQPTDLEEVSTAGIGTALEEIPTPIEPAIPEGQAVEAAQVSEVDLPDWLQNIPMEKHPLELPPKAPQLEPSDVAELPDWLQEIGGEEKQPDQSELKTETEPIVENVSSQPEEAQLQPQTAISDEDASMAWQESLAAEQNVPEKEITTRPEKLPEAPEEPAPHPEKKPWGWRKNLTAWLEETAAAGETPFKMKKTRFAAEFSPEAPEVKELASDEEYTAILRKAHNAMLSGNVESTLAYYEQLIKQEQRLVEVIHDLHEALSHYPMDANIWAALGDAYMRNNQLQEALDAYIKAEELVQ